MRVDGRLDEAVYSTLPPISDFIQQDPVEGVAATEKTDVWLLFDDQALYITFRVWESRMDTLVANEMRRDSNNIFQNDHVAFLIDPFYDRRNGIEFAINALGGRWDGQVSNERNASMTGTRSGHQGRPLRRRLDGGGGGAVRRCATGPPGADSNFNVRRMNKTKNEVSYLTKIPGRPGCGLFRARWRR
jgi:hypothetical protein